MLNRTLKAAVVVFAMAPGLALASDGRALGFAFTTFSFSALLALGLLATLLALSRHNSQR